MNYVLCEWEGRPLADFTRILHAVQRKSATLTTL